MGLDWWNVTCAWKSHMGREALPCRITLKFQPAWSCGSQLLQSITVNQPWDDLCCWGSPFPRECCLEAVPAHSSDLLQSPAVTSVAHELESCQGALIPAGHWSCSFLMGFSHLQCWDSLISPATRRRAIKSHMETSRAEEPDVVSWSSDIPLGKGESWNLNLHRSWQRLETLSHCCSEPAPSQILGDLYGIGKLSFSFLSHLGQIWTWVAHPTLSANKALNLWVLGVGLWLNIPNWHREVPKNKINQFDASESTGRALTTAETAAGWELISAHGIYLNNRGN